jgi:hypothetical protein
MSKRKRRARYQPKQSLLHRCGCIDCKTHPFSSTAKQHRAINRVLLTLDEKSRRRFVGLLASQQGRGGVSALATITGLSRTTINRGRTELRSGDRQRTVRHAGGGRKLVEKNNRVW